MCEFENSFTKWPAMHMDIIYISLVPMRIIAADGPLAHNDALKHKNGDALCVQCQLANRFSLKVNNGGGNGLSAARDHREIELCSLINLSRTQRFEAQ